METEEEGYDAEHGDGNGPGEGGIAHSELPVDISAKLCQIVPYGVKGKAGQIVPAERAAGASMDGQPDRSALRAIGICTCGAVIFKIQIYACGHHRSHCASCGKAWEALDQGQAQDPGGPEAVGTGGDEP